MVAYGLGFAKYRAALRAILAMIGEDDHAGVGLCLPDSARRRGELLNDVREVGRAALAGSSIETLAPIAGGD